jgi:acyl carrier protein
VNEREICTIVLAELKRIAPELDESGLRRDRPLREQIDLDSMDWLNFLVALNQRLGIEIPEADYARLTTLDAVVGYLAAKSCARS